MSDFTNDLQPGDIINVQGPVVVTPLFKDIKECFWDMAVNGAIEIIEKTSKSVFGQVIRPETIHCSDNHTTIYVGDGKIFSCQPPNPEYIPVQEYDTGSPRRIMSIYRLNPAYFGAVTDADLALIKEGCQKVVDLRGNDGKPLAYDIGQNADILVNTVAGYPYLDTIHVFDADGNDCSDDIDLQNPKQKQHMVCSVAAAAVLAYWRHRTLSTTGRDIPQPWKKLNPIAWHRNFIDQYPGHWDIGATFPANFAVTQTHFSGEFKLIGRYKMGARRM